LLTRREIDLAATALAAPEAGLTEIYPNSSDAASIETPADSLANQNQCSSFKVSSRKRGRVSRAPKRNESRHAGTDIPALGADLELHTRRNHIGYSKISHADATVSTTNNVASQLPVSLSTVGLDQQHNDRPPTPQNTCSSPITVGLTLAASTCSYSTASTGPPTSTSSSAEVATGSESEHDIVSDRISLHTVTQCTEARLSFSPVAAQIEVTWLEGDFARSCKTTGDRFVSASSDAGQSVAQTDREISLSPSCKGMPEDTAELNNADECMIASLPASVPIATSPNPTYVAGSDAPNLPGCSASDLTASITTSPRSGRARISLNEGGNDHTPHPIQADAIDVIALTQLPKDSDNDSDLNELVSEHGDYDQREIGIGATLGSTIEGSSNINHSIEQLGQQEMLDTMECVRDVKAEVQVTVSTNGTAVEEEHKTAVSELAPKRRIFWASYGLPLSLYVIASRNSQVKHHLLIQVGLEYHPMICNADGQGVGSGYIGSPYHATFLVVDMPNTGADVPLDEGWRKIVKEAMDNPARAVVSAEWVIHSLDALQLLDLKPYALLLDGHILRRCYPVPAPPSTEARPATRNDAIKDDKTREASARPAVVVEQLEQADKAVSTEPTAVKRRPKRASEPLVSSDAHAGPNRRLRVGRPSFKARQSMPAIPTKRSRRDTTESDLTSSSGSNYSSHALSPLEIRPTLRSDLRKVMDRERDAFLGIQPERPKKKSRLEKDWGFIEELDVVLEEDELAYDVLLDSIRLWIENNDKKDSEEKEVFDKTALLADLQERVSRLVQIRVSES